jgi:hypothetical protein
MSASQRNDTRPTVVDPSLGEILRHQTLLVLEANHEPFDDVRTLAAPDLLSLATIWRDAFSVLDIVGWLPVPTTATIEIAITAGHVAQLRRLRDDEATAVLDCLAVRDGLTSFDEVDAEIHGRRRVAQGLGELLQRYHRAKAT